jgi:hypothetical protein
MARKIVKTLATDAKRSEAGKKTISGEKTERWVSALVIPAIFVVLLVCNARRDSSYSLTIYPQNVSHEKVPIDKAVANSTDNAPKNPDEILTRSSQTMVTVEGIVLYDLQPVSGSNVVVTMSGHAGGPYAVGSAKTKEDGTFLIHGNVITLANFSPEEIGIYAKGGDQGGEQLAYHGQTTLDTNGEFSRRNVNIPAWALALLPIIFFLSLWVAFVRARQAKWKRFKHSTSILLAFLFTLSVIYAISSGLKYVHTEGRKGELLSLGYAFLFKDSYSADGPQEWIFSFTSPKKVLNADASAGGAEANDQNNISAFGAPLWVILLSVIGASISTVKLIVRETKDTLDYEKEEKKFWQRIQHIVQHQFLILFAPLGAIFVYQMLVAADAINKPSTVALAALGAGPTINYLLARAINLSKNLVESNGSATEEGTEESSDKGLLQHRTAA